MDRFIFVRLGRLRVFGLIEFFFKWVFDVFSVLRLMSFDNEFFLILWIGLLLMYRILVLVGILFGILEIFVLL